MKTDQLQLQNNRTYNQDQVLKLMDRLHALRDAQPSVQLDLGVLAEQLTAPRAKTFALQALGRRLAVVERTVLNVFRTYPPDRSKAMGVEECTDIAIQLHAFAINVYAIFDSISWVCVLQAGLDITPEKIGPFKRGCQAALPKNLQSYLNQDMVRKWFTDYGKVYRDSTAHRIPPYLPPRVMTPEEVTLWQELDAESKQVLTESAALVEPELINEFLRRHERLESEKDALGQNSLLIGLSLDGQDASPLVYLHPQLLCDWGLVQEVILVFTKTMREEYKWVAPFIPSMVVRGPI